MIDLFNEAEKPLPLAPYTGPTAGLGEIIGKGIMRGGVRVAQGAAMAASAVFPSESEEEFVRRQAQAPEERTGLPSKEDFFRFIEERLDPALEYWSPDPGTVTTAGQVVGALFELPLQLAAGPAGIIATPTFTTGKELVQQGVDAKTATGAAVATGVAMGAAVSLPAAGRTIKETLALVGLNPLIGAGQEAITREVLQSQGYADQAKMFDPWDPAARSIDLILGGVFGGLAQYGQWKARAPQQVADAIDTVEAAKQRENLSPFVAGHTKEHRQALQKALRDFAEGKPVDVSRVIESTAPKPAEPTYNAAKFKEQVQQVFGATEEQADMTLALIAARAKVTGKSVDDYISLRIADVRQGMEGEAVLFQDRPTVPPFHSKVLAEVDALQQEKWNGGQLLGKLRKTQGVKEEEIAWTGLDEFLAGREKVTRQEVRQYLEENQVRVQEVMKGDYSTDLQTLYSELLEKNRNKPFDEWNPADQDLWMERRGEPRKVKYANYTLPGGENYRELLLTLPRKLVSDGSGDVTWNRKSFNSSHYNEPDILAHVRFNERTGANGERILHLEEIQSDWHQAGRSKGYQSEGGPIPDAPLSKSWHEMTLRRMLRHAAENGFDRLTLTTGEQQAARYDLSKKLQNVRYDFQDGQYKIIGQDLDGQVHPFGTFAEGQLEDALGKDLAGKIIESRESGKSYALFSGTDLKIGGEGMRGFYDKILPRYLDKFGKKFGARVEPAEIPNGERAAAEAEVQRLTEKYNQAEGASEKAFALALLQEANRKLRQMEKTVQLHSIPITEQMRSALLYEGTPLFQGEKGAVSFLDDGRAVIHALESPDFSTLIHEIGHIFRRDLPASELRELETWLLSRVPGSKWDVQAEEKFARAFERYLAEGKAPSDELQGVFDKFKNWLVEIYKRITGTAIDVKLAPQVRQVFDRMLVTAPLKTDVPPDVARGRDAARQTLQEMAEDSKAWMDEDLFGETDPLNAIFEGIPDLQSSDAVAGFMRSPENVSRTLADFLEAEAAGLESATAENLVIDGHRLEATLSTAADWYLEANRAMRSSGSAMDKRSVVNALRRAAQGDFARLTDGQQQMVTNALEAISRQAQSMAREIDVQDLKVGDRYATADLGQRVVVGERDGVLYLDNGQTLDLSEMVQIVGEIDRRARPENMPDSPAEFYLQEQGDFEIYTGTDSEGNPIMRSAAELIGEGRAELAKAESQEHLYKRAAFCLNLA